MPSRRALPAHLTELAEHQDGLLARRQLLAAGLTDGFVDAQLTGGRWTPSGLPGVYVTHTGPVDHRTRCWAGLLYTGAGATLGLQSAAWLWGLGLDPPGVVHVLVPGNRRVQPQPGLRMHIRVHLDRRRHQARTPPVTTVDETVLDLADQAGASTEVVDLLTKACQRRLTNAQRLQAAMVRRKKLRWRRLMEAVLRDVTEGAHSPLEVPYLRHVERAHGLPRGRRNQPDDGPGHRVYRDVDHRRFGFVVELDGSATHPGEARELDHRRDAELLVREGVVTVRYGWAAVLGRPCELATEVALLSRRGGWTGQPRPCSPGCPVTAFDPP